jgi:hypothetical protein
MLANVVEMPDQKHNVDVSCVYKRENFLIL